MKKIGEMRYLVCKAKDSPESIEAIAVFRNRKEAESFQVHCIKREHRYNKPRVVYVVNLKTCHILKNDYYGFENLVKLTGSAFETRTILVLLEAVDQRVENFARQYIKERR